MKSYRTVLRCFCVDAATIGAAHGQTQIDLHTQGNTVFSPAARTRPLEFGTLLPAALASRALECAQ
jgi:hypothetical protein